jgi:tetratricopeptide (TPR) repeat protein
LAEALLPFGATGGKTWTYSVATDRSIENGIDDTPAYLIPRFGLRIGASKFLGGPIWSFDPEKVDVEDLRDAVAEFREAIRLDPTLVYLRRPLANVLILKGEIENAVLEYREAARLAPKDSSLHTEAAHRLYLRGKLDLATAAIQEAIRLDPTSQESHTLLGIIYHEQGKPSQAFAEYREALFLSGSFAFLRHALEATGKPEDVDRAYREAAIRRPGNPAVSNDFAWELATLLAERHREIDAG